MQLTVEVLTRADGRHALFLGDRCLCHVKPDALRKAGLDYEENVPAVGLARAARDVGARIARRAVKKAARRIAKSQKTKDLTGGVSAQAASQKTNREGGARLTAAERATKQAEARALAGQGKTLSEIEGATGVKYATLWGWQKAGVLASNGRTAPPRAPASRTTRTTASEIARSWME